VFDIGHKRAELTEFFALILYLFLKSNLTDEINTTKYLDFIKCVVSFGCKQSLQILS